MTTSPIRELRKAGHITRRQLANYTDCTVALIEAAEIGVLHWQTDPAPVLLAISRLFPLMSVEALTAFYHRFAEAQYEDARRALEGE